MAAALLALPWPTRQAPTVAVSLAPEFVALPASTTFRVVTRAEIPEGWHIGWTHPGQTGLPTTLAWRVSPGITVGSTAWPFPERMDSGGAVSHIYRGVALIATSFTVSADAPARPVDLVAEVRWGICREICVPQERQLRISLPIVGGARTPEGSPDWPGVRSVLDATLPIEPEDVGLVAQADPQGIRLVAPRGSPRLRGAATGRLVFFPEDSSRAAVAVVVQPRVTAAGLVVPVGLPRNSRVAGVLVSERPWGAPGTSRALRIAVSAP